MRTFLRPRYGCDYCKKVGGSKHHMAKHEAGCTANPNRVCKLHRFAAEDEDPPTVGELIAAQLSGGYARVCEVSHNCPACKLAASRQSPVGDGVDGWQEWTQFDYKAEMAALWQEFRQSERESAPRYY